MTETKILQEIYDAAWAAQQRNVKRKFNPYVETTEAYKVWHQGWDESKAGIMDGKLKECLEWADSQHVAFVHLLAAEVRRLQQFEPELKPCPFCGGEAYRRPEDWDVSCTQCGVRTYGFRDQIKTIAAWNRREGA